MIYAIVNPKGGTGKTETVFHLARLWPETGRRLLVIGLDPVGSITRKMLGLGDNWREHVDPALTMAQALRNQARLDKIARPSIYAGVDVAPESPDLERLEGELASEPLGTFRLLSALRSLDGAGLYDDILIDAPGALGALVDSAILASDRIVVASAPAENSIDGLRALLNHYGAIYRDPSLSMLRPQLPAALIVGQVITQYRGSIVSHRDAAAGLVQLLPLLGTVGLHDGRDADALRADAYAPILWHLLEGIGGYPVDWPALEVLA